MVTITSLYFEAAFPPNNDAPPARNTQRRYLFLKRPAIDFFRLHQNHSCFGANSASSQFLPIEHINSASHDPLSLMTAILSEYVPEIEILILQLTKFDMRPESPARGQNNTARQATSDVFPQQIEGTPPFPRPPYSPSLPSTRTCPLESRPTPL